MKYKCVYQSPIGNMIMLGEGNKLYGIWFEDKGHFDEQQLCAAATSETQPAFKAARAWLDEYFEGKQPGELKAELALEGSEFRRTVWEILLEIPYGKSLTYGEIAKLLEKKLGRKMSARAVGGAVGHNPISIIIPCHRVLGKEGRITGYAGGIDRKIALLKLENIEWN